MGRMVPLRNLQPADGAQHFLREVIDLLGPGNVQIITARSAASASMTRHWLQRHSFPDITILFADDKPTVASQRGCNVAVEDSIRHARSYSDSGMLCFLIAPPNAYSDDLPGVVRVDSLTPIPGLLRDEIERIDDGKNGTAAFAARPRIVISDAIDPDARVALAEVAEIIDVDGTDTPALLAVLGDADALIVRSETQVTPEVIAAGPNLRVIARAGVGVDNVDLDAATRAGVLVLNAPGANRYSAGEHTIALLLAITRQIPRANESTHAGRWERKKVKPIDLRGRTVGIVGLGRVGGVVAKRLAAFEMKILAYDPYIAESRFAEHDAESVTYEELLRRSDIITYHVPSTPETRNMLCAETFPLLKDGVIVINCSRGDVVDQNVLAEALKSGAVAAAGVDVFPHEPCIDSPLFRLPNAILTPHIGGSSQEALKAVGEMISSSVICALNGQAVPNAVNLPPASLVAPELQRLTSVASAAGHLLAVLQPSPPAGFRMTVNGNMPDDVTEHVAGAALSEAMHLWTHRRVTPVNARLIAEELGMEVQGRCRHPRSECDSDLFLRSDRRAGGTRASGADRLGSRHRRDRRGRPFHPRPPAGRRAAHHASSRRAGRHRPGRHGHRPIRHQYRRDGSRSPSSRRRGDHGRQCRQRDSRWRTRGNSRHPWHGRRIQNFAASRSQSPAAERAGRWRRLIRCRPRRTPGVNPAVESSDKGGIAWRRTERCGGSGWAACWAHWRWPERSP